jgi:hypothetical protein
MGAGASEETMTFFGRCYDAAATIQLKLMGIENVVHEHYILTQTNSNVQPQSNGSYNRVAAIHKSNEVPHGKIPVVHGSAGGSELCVELVFLFTAKKQWRVAGLRQAMHKVYPIFLFPAARGPSLSAAGVQSYDTARARAQCRELIAGWNIQ